MHQEIELKLRLRADFLAKIPSLFAPLAPHFQQQDWLVNTYYDSINRAFAQQKSILRVREQNGTCTLTAKLSGDVMGGLHSHPEYNLPLADKTPNLEALAQHFHLTLPCKSTDLRPIFQTNFQRKTWLVPFSDSQIEVALDEGEILADEKTEAICELEFELKQGRTEDILSFVKHHITQDGATLSATNKAKRGYWLAQGERPVPFDAFTQWQHIAFAPKIRYIYPFLQFEQQLMENCFRLGKEFFAVDFMRSVRLIGAFFHLYNFCCEQGELFFHACENLPANVKAQFDPKLFENLMFAHHQAYDCIKEIMQNHSQSRNNRQALDALWQWLYSNTQLQRCLSAMLLSYYEQQ